MRQTLFTLCAFSFFAIAPAVSAEILMPLPASSGHQGEKPAIAYHVEYHDSLGVTTAGPTGITFAPFGYYPTFDPTVLPERYFRTYPLYFAGGAFAFTLHLENVGKRTYRNLMVITAQEYLNPEGGAGVPFSGGAAHNWFVRKLGPGERIALSGSLTLPMFGSSGIDQTHLQILHWENDTTEPDEIGQGRILLDDPQAGLWCPL